MESEYTVLSISSKDILPFEDLMKELGGCLGISITDSFNLHTKIHDDNISALILGKLEFQQMTLRSKYYAIKYR